MREISRELLGSFRLSIDFQFIIPGYPLFPLPLPLVLALLSRKSRTDFLPISGFNSPLPLLPPA